jgi:hypothetical protein
MPLFPKQQLQVPRDVAPCNIHPLDRMVHGKPFVHGHGVGDTIARVEHHAGDSGL